MLRKDGTCWVNMGDCYATGAGAVGKCPGGGSQGTAWTGPVTQPNRMPQAGLKPKDLVGQPWRLAFALQADGWYLRQDIIWHKPSPMPESVQDRCTKAHEYLFLLTKSERYFWDVEAMKEPAEYAGDQAGICRGTKRRAEAMGRKPSGNEVPGANWIQPETRNRRSVWTIPTEPYSEAHFATFPTALVRPCILAGCPVGGTVLDPFGGSGTTAAVAIELGRKAILCELNPEYVAMAEARLRAVTPGLPLQPIPAAATPGNQAA